MFTSREERLFNVAKSVAATSKHPKARVGAALVHDGHVVSVGVNGKKSHPLQAHYNSFRYDDDGGMTKHLMHAEIEAIVKARSYLHHISSRDIQIYVYRVMKDGSKGMARPCAGCMQALRDFGIKEVYYSTNDGLVYEKVDLK